MGTADRRNLFQHGEMALVLLALLRQQPMHGYDLLAELERLLPGYRASPGSVYPALAGLVDEVLLEAVVDDRHSRRRAFRITATGRRALQQRAGLLAAFEVRTGARLSNASTIEAALDRLRVRVIGVAERLDPELVAEELDKVASVLESAAHQGGAHRHG